MFLIFKKLVFVLETSKVVLGTSTGFVSFISSGIHLYTESIFLHIELFFNWFKLFLEHGFNGVIASAEYEVLILIITKIKNVII